MKKGSVTRRELVLSLTEKLGFTQRRSSELVDAVFRIMRDTMAAGESIKLVQFGTLSVRDKSPRRGRNPRTGEKLKIAAKKAPAFKAGKTMKDAVDKK